MGEMLQRELAEAEPQRIFRDEVGRVASLDAPGTAGAERGARLTVGIAVAPASVPRAAEQIGAAVVANGVGGGIVGGARGSTGAELALGDRPGALTGRRAVPWACTADDREAARLADRTSALWDHRARPAGVDHAGISRAAVSGASVDDLDGAGVSARVDLAGIHLRASVRAEVLGGTSVEGRARIIASDWLRGARARDQAGGQHDDRDGAHAVESAGSRARPQARLEERAP